MIRLMALIFASAAVCFAADKNSPPGAPSFSLAFHLIDSAHVKVQTLNKQAELGLLQFPGKLKGSIHSDGVRIGGARVGLKGTYYDAESQSIMHVGAGIEITGPEFSFAGFPVGDYFLSVEVQGSSVYTKRIHLPMPDVESDNYIIKIPKRAEFSGHIENIPIWALESPLIGIGSSLAQIDKDGNFKFWSSAIPEEKFILKFRFTNKYLKEWGQPLYRLEFICERQSAMEIIKLPDVGDWKILSGRVNFATNLPVGLKPVLQNVSILVMAKDGSINYRCNPDPDGKFLIIGLPDRDYTIQIDDFGNPPFICEPIALSITGHQGSIPFAELTLHPHRLNKAR